LNVATGRTRKVDAAVAGAVGGAVLIVAGSAQAHAGTGLPGGFASGFEHPLSGLDHLLAMVSVGLWGAFLGRPLIYLLPVIFPTVMAGGAVLAMMGLRLPSVELGIALSVLVLGGCIAFAVRAPIPVAAIIVGAFALFHGYAHGKELPSAADPIGYSAGFVLATGLLHVLGIGIGTVNVRPAGVLATRSAGGLIAATGLWFVYQAVTR
jgi:urease accessory protein